MKAGLGQLGQDHALFEAAVLAHQQAAGLGDALDDQRIGHHRRAGKVVVQVLLGQRDILDGRGPPATFELGKAINPKPTHEFKG